MTWNICDGIAEANFANQCVKVDPVRPLEPATLQVTQSDTDSWKLFQVQPLPSHSFSVEESYVRGSDLITAFDQSEADQFAFQLNYRILMDPAPGIEVWMSVQTDDLDSEPVLKISCNSPSGEYWEILTHDSVLGTDIKSADSGPAALISSSNGQTGIWLIQPSDQRHAELLSSPGEPTQSIELFDHFMEKGVIRRARMRFHLHAGEVSDSQLKSLYEAFANSDLPLTA